MVLLPSLAGCTLVQLRGESRSFYEATVLVGRVSAPPGWQGPIVVAATTRIGNQITIAHQVRLHEPGGYELIVPDGSYTLLAYGDRDGNGVPDGDDPAAQRNQPVEVAGTGMLALLDMTLTAGSATAVRGLLPSVPPAPPAFSTQAGALADLSAAAFSAESGSDGYWAPMETFRRVGGNIYFVEPYDPARIPVLFVHGAAGSAQDWRHFISTLDRRRYQAWVFQYPSGAALDSMANLLYWKLQNLQLRYRFERLHLVAHSMGGLVVRRFLLDHRDEFPQLGQFISLSTPWGGESTAALGVQHSPAVVPSWRDMQPAGPYLKRLFERPLPPGIVHTLLFSHRGGYSLMRPNTDGTVTLASQLRPEAQAQARLVMGFDESHDSVLAAPLVIGQVARLLDAAEQPGGGPVGGRLQVELSLDGAGTNTPSGVPVLAISPAGREGAAARQLIPLIDNADGRLVGPIEPGVYDVRLSTLAFRSTPARQQVTVEAGGQSRLAFRLSPQGALAGYVGAPGDALAQPAGSTRPPHPTLRILRISLDGPGGPASQRVLVPRAQGEPEILSAYLDGRDDAVGALFSFVDLPAGEHVLTIVAEGHEPHVSRYRVVPGQATPMQPIVLRPSR